MPARQWQGSTDGTLWMHKALVALLRVLPLSFVYLLVALSIPFYLVFAPEGRRAIYRYFRRRQGYGRVRAALCTAANHFVFGTIVVDRFAAYAGRRFKIGGGGREVWEELCTAPGGFVVLSSHVGGVEMCGYMLSSGKTMNVLTFPGEAESIKQGRERLLSGNNVRIHAAGPDMSHLFALNNALADGEIVSIFADRLFGSGKALEVSILGSPARIPEGPFALAAMREVPALAVFAFKTGVRRYDAQVIRLSIPSGLPRPEAEAELAKRYAAVLDEALRKHPLQWFNFYDFWEDCDGSR